jgi:flagellar basal body P-ring formation protein FlgA
MKRFVSAILIFVSLFGIAAAEELTLMPVPLRTIFPGQPLDASEFTMKLFSVPESARQSYVFEKEKILHMEAARSLTAGNPVKLLAIHAIKDVKRGLPTKAVYASGQIEIQGLLLPVTDGSAGEIIETRNMFTHVVVKAEVLPDGTLLVVQK